MTDNAHIRAVDPDVANLIDQEIQRQRDVLRLIPSENYASAAVLQATGSCLTNKYSEGYVGRRYYQGQDYIDGIEGLAIQRAKELFGAEHVNVQPYSGSPANLAVYLGLLNPGDGILSMSLPHGGHLTHGWKVTISGQYFNAVQYGVDKDSKRIDMDQVAAMAREHKPKLIICGASAYPRIIDFAAFAEIAKEVGAYLLADIAHISGLVAGGAHPSPVPYADVVSTTTHKTLRGPRGGMLMCKSKHAKAIDRGVFPGLQGGPHNHTTGALAIALKEALQPEFRDYAAQTVRNCQALADGLLTHDFDLVSGGTDNHLLLVDLSNKNISGKIAAKALEKAGIVCNANSVPFDTRKPFDPSGIRIGTPALTSRGMGPDEMHQLADWINSAINLPDDETALSEIARSVKALCDQFPAPGI
ncbi:MAG: serine hydroxymethyltransferase [Myxococcales bacterium]|nr:serine hydroxymethyltransferase [Myxococcales bacterium]